MEEYLTSLGCYSSVGSGVGSSVGSGGLVAVDGGPGVLGVLVGFGAFVGGGSVGGIGVDVGGTGVDVGGTGVSVGGGGCVGPGPGG